MYLRELLQYDDIVIQCHDNPDADALASGLALYRYLQKRGKNPRFLYRGLNRISKGNLLIMKEKLEIPIRYEPDFEGEAELLVTVDCQYGQRNVSAIQARNIAVIDHHQSMEELPPLSEVRSNIGSCSTVIWDMLQKEGFSVDTDSLLSTALYYGLYTDTNKLSEVSHPLDRDMRDSLTVNKSLITEMSNSSISLDELKLTGKAIFDYEYHGKNKCLLIRADRCDPNVLGVISDFAMETVGVDICLAYFVSEQEIKFSVRSCIREVHANELAAFLAEGIGGGGGHMTKAGGTIRPEKLQKAYTGPLTDTEDIVSEVFSERLNAYLSMYRVLYARDTLLDTSEMKLYEKLPQKLGCVKLTEIFPAGTTVEIRTLEGDIDVQVQEDIYLMIGIEGEVYPIKKEKLESSYRMDDSPYDRTFEYTPSIKEILTGERKSVLGGAHSVISKGGVRIWAKPLTEHIKLFTAWDEEKYYSGKPGDYIARREDDLHDIYIISGSLFDQLYRGIEE
ncbi:MAG: DHH family phosphoesterase [Lachnospiraceae bacterium]|nr:DHH family phosphoesterase [Lachnospiraceae bacterium]